MHLIRRTLSIALVMLFSSHGFTQEMRVTLLGTGTPGPYTDRAGPATLIQAGEQSLLIDAGRNVTVQLWQDRIPFREIDAVFLTHFHHDHINGLADLWLTGWLGTDYGSRSVPLLLIGPEGTQNVAAGLEMAYSRNNEIRVLDENLSGEAASFTVQEFSTEGIIYEQDGVTVRTFEVNHGELITPAVGYRVDYAGLSVVISGDTTYDEGLASVAEGVDLLVHEVMAWDDAAMQAVPSAAQIAAHHTTPEEAGRIFQMAVPKLAAYSHLVIRGVSDEEIIRRTRTTYPGPLVVGKDMMHFVISNEGVEIRGQ